MNKEQRIIIKKEDFDKLFLLIGNIVDTTKLSHGKNTDFDNAVADAYLKLHQMENESQVPDLATLYATANDCVYYTTALRGYKALYRQDLLTQNEIDDLQSTLNACYACAKMAWEDIQRYALAKGGN